MRISSIGIDLGKTTFHLIALDDHGKIVIRKKFSRKQLLAYTANLQPALVGIEACSGAHFVGAALRRQGHDVRLIPAQFVKPFVKVEQKRFHRCRDDRRSRYPAEHESEFFNSYGCSRQLYPAAEEASPRVAIRGYTRL
jgi:transposase